MNINNNNDANEFWYDKNEFYAENGLAKGHKKDRKSRSKIALDQAEERQKKQDDHISQLPSKMQKLLLKEKTIKAVKVFAKKEDPVAGKIHKKITNPVKNTSQNVAYDDTEYEEEEYDDKDTLRDEAYEAGLEMYKRYGLTKEQYDADLSHREDILALAAYNEDPENYHAPPDYGSILEERIRKYEDEFEAKTKAEEEEQRYVNWYYDEDLDLNPYEWSALSYPVIEVEVEDEEPLEDYIERMREQDMEFAMENARDDIRDD
jgi:hypothetical protein